MNRILTNCRIINPAGSQPLIERGFIVINDQQISGVGSGDPPDTSGFQIDDLKGKTVLPGMINAHTHLYSALALGMPWPSRPPRNFVEKLEKVWWLLDRGLDEESTRASFQAGLLESIRSGVTTVIDHHSSQNCIPGSLDILAETAQEFGVNVALAFEITDRNGRAGFRTGLQENLDALSSYRDHRNIRPLIGLHASFTLSDDSLAAIGADLAEKEDWGIHIHVAEDQADHEDVVRRGYPSVIQRLNHFGLINERSLIIHGIYLLPEDVTLLGEAGALQVHNPTSNANNRVGILPAETISRLQGGLGTDGMQANLLKEAKEGTLIRSQTLAGGAENVDYLRLLFENNPRIASRIFDRSLGKIEVGNGADLTVYDYCPRTELTAENYGGHLLFGLERPCAVIAAGQYLMRDNDFVTIDETSILDNARQQSTRLWTAIDKLKTDDE